MSEADGAEPLDLGGLGAWSEGLPASWLAAISRCPFCTGVGSEQGVRCVRCEGTGDLFGAMLRDAFVRGQGSVLTALREVERVRRARVAFVREETADARSLQVQLRRQMGLGR